MWKITDRDLFVATVGIAVAAITVFSVGAKLIDAAVSRSAKTAFSSGEASTPPEGLETHQGVAIATRVDVSAVDEKIKNAVQEERKFWVKVVAALISTLAIVAFGSTLDN